MEEKFEVLFIDDNPADARLAELAFREAGYNVAFTRVVSGETALQRLVNFKPTLILLDLNLPGKNGLDILATIKTNPETRSIPVIVLSTSQNKADIRSAYDNHANSYLVKPVDFEDFSKHIRALADFWFGTSRLP